MMIDVLSFIWISLQILVVKGSARAGNKVDPLILSDLHVFNLPEDVYGLLPATKSIAVAIPRPRAERLINYAQVDLNSAKRIVKLSADGQSVFFLFRGGKTIFPERKFWGTGRYVTPKDYTDFVVEVEEDDFVVMLVSYENRMEITKPDIIAPLEEVVHMDAYELGDYAELFLLELCNPFSFAIIMAQVVRKSESKSTYCLMKHQQDRNTNKWNGDGSFNLESEIGGTFTRNGKYVLDWASSSEMDEVLFVPSHEPSLFNSETDTETEPVKESIFSDRNIIKAKNPNRGRHCIIL